MVLQESDLREQLDRLEILGEKWLAKLNESRPTTATVGSATIVIQAGGFFALILFFVAAITLGMSIATAFEISPRMDKIEQKQDEQSQYLNAIYMMSPQLKPKEKLRVDPTK